MNLTFTNSAWEDYLWFQDAQPHLLKRLNELIKDARRNGFQGIGKPEPLKGDLSGCWSRRINSEHRLVYRRDKTFGTPIYFAPYFTKVSNKTVGISNLSKVLGVLTFKPSEFENIKDDLASFSDNQAQIDNWISGIQLDSNFTSVDNEQTFYFLDKPLTFRRPLIKDYKNSKGWIGKRIPKNRTVSFIDFVKHIPELMGNWKD